MKNKLLLLSLLMGLTACVEIKDPEQIVNEAGDEKPAVVQKATQLIVDQPLYIFEDRVLTKSQFEAENRWPSSEKKLVHTYDYMEIREGGILYTLGQTVRIEVGSLISEGAIETFPKGSYASELENGRDGGVLDLQVKKAEGQLRIVMRGQNGGRGKDGGEPDASLTGERGEALTGRNCKDPEAQKRWLGGKGKPGYAGSPGTNGGKSGYLNLVVHEYERFIFPFEILGGEPGTPGIGNRRGGRPGPPGEVQHCFAVPGLAHRHEYYPNLFGDPGPDGKVGQTGIRETPTISDKGKFRN